MKFTNDFEAMRSRPDRADIRLEWIQRVIDHPVKQIIQADGRIRRWRPSPKQRVDTFVLFCCPMAKPYTMLSSTGDSIMKIKYFQDSDTLHIELRAAKMAETNDVDENTLLDLDESGKLCGITIEHAADRVDLPNFSCERMAV